MKEENKKSKPIDSHASVEDISAAKPSVVDADTSLLDKSDDEKDMQVNTPNRSEPSSFNTSPNSKNNLKIPKKDPMQNTDEFLDEAEN